MVPLLCMQLALAPKSAVLSSTPSLHVQQDAFHLLA